MHIPDMMIQGAVCPVTAGFAAIGLAGTAYAAWKSQTKPAAASFAAVSALIFAGQMLNFPIQPGTSGHILGATLAVALLGSGFGILAMALVVTAQCFVFGDGGISVLGANLLNMALIAALPAVAVRELILKPDFSAARRTVAYCLAAWISIIAAAFACSVEMAAAGAVPLQKILPPMLSVHAWIGLGEAAVTFAACALLMPHIVSVPNRRMWLAPLAAAVVMTLLLSPFASGSPDGLNWVAESLGILKTSAPLFVSPFADYTVPVVTSEAVSTALAGFIGAVMVFAAGCGVGKIWSKA
ncbi:MAG: energy-coupling factor ABC transporter permease [Planctomycetaceae bacterium]|jgi:cobalt/nickel transport system permease protein|nr:energy-coupling factor ABC transporter permease [Planctomycetaceae bacterium]